MKRASSIILCLILFFLLAIPCSAHPGSLDSNGGHWNHSTGEYHYHSGTHTPGSSSNNSSPSSSTPKDWADDDPAFELTFGHVVLVLMILLPIGLAVWSHFPTKYDNVTKEEQPPPPAQAPPKSNTPPSAPHTPPPAQKPTTTPPKYKPTYRARKSRPKLSTKPRKPRNALIQTNPNTSAVYDPAFFSPNKQKQFEESLKTDRLKNALSENIIVKDIRQDTSTKPITVSCRTISKDGVPYDTTLTKCTCPDCKRRHVVCKHMILLAIKVKAVTLDTPLVETSADKELISLMENVNDSADNDLPF